MAIIRSLVVKIKGDASSLEKSLKTSSRELQKSGKQMIATGNSLTMGLTVPVIAAGVAITKLSSDYTEALNKVNVVFEENAKSVEAWSKTTLKQYGIAKGTALDMASLYGDMGTSMEIPVDMAAEISKSLVGLAGDWASFKNISLGQANTAAKGIFTGETESLKNIGIVMTQTNLEAFALSKGIDKSLSSMSEAEKVALRYGYVIEKSSNAMGDFARTGGGTANRMRVFTETLKQLGQTLNGQVLPVVTPYIVKLTELAQSFASLDENQQKAILTTALLLAALGPSLSLAGKLTVGWGLFIGRLAAFIKVVKGGGGVIAALKALIGPVGVTVLSIAAIAEVVYIVVKTFDTFKTFMGAVWKLIVSDVSLGVQNVVTFFAYLDYMSNKLLLGMAQGWMDNIKSMLDAASEIPKIGDEFAAASEKIDSVSDKINKRLYSKKSAYDTARAHEIYLTNMRSEAFKEVLSSGSAWGSDVWDTLGGQVQGVKDLFSGVKDLFSGTSMELPDLSLDESMQVDWMDFITGMDSGLSGIEDSATSANSALEDMVNTVRTMVDEIRSQTRSFAEFVGLFDKAEKSFVSGDSLLRRLKGQVMTMKQWQQDLLTLQSKGMSGFMVNELRSMGPGSANEIAGLARLSSSKLAEYEALYSQKYGIAGQQAAATVGYNRSAENIIESQIILDVSGNYIIGDRNIDELTDKIVRRLKAAHIIP